MVSCSDFLAELGAYLDGDVNADLRRALEQHLAHCVTCQVLADSTAKTIKIVTESGEFDLSEDLPVQVVNRIMDRVRQSRSEKDQSMVDENSGTD